MIDFVAIMERSSIRDAALKLHNLFVTSTSSPAPPVGGKGSEPKQKAGELVAKTTSDESSGGVNTPLSFTLKDIDPTHPYLRDRGITEETAKHFGVGFFPGRGQMLSRIVFPVNNERGELVAYAGRSIDGVEPKYKLPPGFKKSAVLWNLDRVRALDAASRDQVIVVEGFFDCMKVHQSGFPNVVALMGSTLSVEQENLLYLFSHVMLFLDGDDAGRTASQSIATRLVSHMFVRVINLPDGEQPDQLSSGEIHTILA